MAKYDKHQRDVARELKQITKELHMLREIKEILVMMLDKRQFEEYKEQVALLEASGDE